MDSLGSLRAHLQRFWPDSAYEDMAPAHPLIQLQVPGFLVRRIAPARDGEPWVYATIGASRHSVKGAPGIEFFLLSPVQDRVLVELLAAVAMAHADPAYSLRIGSTLRLGRPWLADSEASYLLVSPPYPYGPGLEICQRANLHVLWLVPITAAEAEIVREQGHEALVALLEQAAANVVAVHRPSVI